ncbi:MAG: hypothetical protein ABFD79_01545 [Phycisphaerales bacterium]
MKNIISILIISVSISFLTGCGSNVKKMTVSDMSLENKHPYSVQLETTGWEKIDKLQTSGLTNERYSKSLANSINNTGLFKEVLADNANYKLKVEVVQHVLPGHIGDFVLKASTKWQLTDSQNKVVWTQTIDSAYTSKLIDEVTTFDRLQKANENLIKLNIEEGIKRLSQYKL